MDNAIKYKLVEKIIQSDDEIILNDIKALLGFDKADFWNELPDAVKSGIKEAQSELRDGKGISHEDVMNEVKNRFLK